MQAHLLVYSLPRKMFYPGKIRLYIYYIMMTCKHILKMFMDLFIYKY